MQGKAGVVCEGGCNNVLLLVRLCILGHFCWVGGWLDGGDVSSLF